MFWKKTLINNQIQPNNQNKTRTSKWSTVTYVLSTSNGPLYENTQRWLSNECEGKKKENRSLFYE